MTDQIVAELMKGHILQMIIMPTIQSKTTEINMTETVAELMKGHILHMSEMDTTQTNTTGMMTECQSIELSKDVKSQTLSRWKTTIILKMHKPSLFYCNYETR